MSTPAPQVVDRPVSQVVERRVEIPVDRIFYVEVAMPGKVQSRTTRTPCNTTRNPSRDPTVRPWQQSARAAATPTLIQHWKSSEHGDPPDPVTHHAASSLGGTGFDSVPWDPAPLRLRRRRAAKYITAAPAARRLPTARRTRGPLTPRAAAAVRGGARRSHRPCPRRPLRAGPCPGAPARPTRPDRAPDARGAGAGGRGPGAAPPAGGWCAPPHAHRRA